MISQGFKAAIKLALISSLALRAFPTTAPPEFTSTINETNSSIRFDFQTVPGFGYQIEASTNFIDWIFFSSLLAAKDRDFFTFPSAGFAPNNFFRLREFGPAPNDQFTNSFELKGATARTTASNLAATSEPGEPAHGLFNSNGKSVWWSWVAPADGYANLSSVGTCFDTLLAVYTGTSVTNLESVARKRSWTKQLTFPAESGKTYRIAVDGNPTGFQAIRLNLTFTNAPFPNVLTSVTNTSIVVNDTSHPLGGERQVVINADGSHWTEYTYGLTNTTWDGHPFEYAVDNATAHLRLVSDYPFYTNILDYALTFVTDRSGFYQRFINGEPHGYGTFSDFRSVAGGLAPPSLWGVELQTTNVSTSLGSGGQTHSFTFDPGGSYHDSDGTDQSWGNYSYSNDGDIGTADLRIEAPLLFRGDHYHLRMKFASTTTGTFDGSYLRNDGSLILITGNFILDYGK